MRKDYNSPQLQKAVDEMVDVYSIVSLAKGLGITDQSIRKIIKSKTEPVSTISYLTADIIEDAYQIFKDNGNRLPVIDKYMAELRFRAFQKVDELTSRGSQGTAGKALYISSDTVRLVLSDFSKVKPATLEQIVTQQVETLPDDYHIKTTRVCGLVVPKPVHLALQRLKFAYRYEKRPLIDMANYIRADERIMDFLNKQEDSDYTVIQFMLYFKGSLNIVGED